MRGPGVCNVAAPDRRMCTTRWGLSRSVFFVTDAEARVPGGTERGGKPPGWAVDESTAVREFECEEGDLNPHGCYPTSPSN